MKNAKKLLAVALVAMMLLPSVAMAWYCAYCGAQNSWNFCQMCGQAKNSGGSSSSSYTADVYALANQRISTRTGPGTQYTEGGTYYLGGQYLRLTYKAWDSRNSIYWVLVDIPGVGQLWTGAKRFDNLDLSQLPDWNGSSSSTGSGSGTGTGSWSSGFGQNNATGGSQYNWLIGKTGTVCVNEGIVRSGAGTNYYEIGVIFRGETYEILDVCRGNTTKDWCKIRFDGQYAWISSGLLEIDGIQGGTIYGVWAP